MNMIFTPMAYCNGKLIQLLKVLLLDVMIVNIGIMLFKHQLMFQSSSKILCWAALLHVKYSIWSNSG